MPIQRSEKEMSGYREIASVRSPHDKAISTVILLIVLVWVYIFYELLHNAFVRAAQAFGLSFVLTVLMALLMATRRCTTCRTVFEQFENADLDEEYRIHYFIACPNCKSFFRESCQRSD
jgi:hypothetical protein